MRFIVKTGLDGRTALRVASSPVIEMHAKLHRALTDLVGADAARLFAEPVITWGNGEAPGSVSWYADADGDARALRNLPPAVRARHEPGLRAVLMRLLPLRADTSVGPLLTRALAVADADSILLVGERVVLVNWGMLPAESVDTPAGLAAHFETTFGPYLASDAARPQSPMAPPAIVPPQPSGIGPGRAGGSSPSRVPPVMPSPATSAREAASVWNHWLVPIGLATAALFFALGLVLGARTIERQTTSRASTAHIGNADAIRDAIARRQAENAALEGQIAATRRALAGNMCVADPVKVPASVPPETPIVPAMAAPAPAGQPPFRGTLVELLRQATVLVLVPKSSDLELGSGFFIGPKLVATNRHVVEQAGPDGILVVNTKLGRPLRATVRAETPNSNIYSPDVAVLEVADAPPIQPLGFTRTVEQLDTVVAAGFPGVLLGSDSNFRRLLDGNAAAMPSVILTDGRINAVQTAPTGLPILPHSAQIAPGNSGGPLVDACGRVVGINTFINVSTEQAVHINYAEKADAVLAFLASRQIAAAESSTPCRPGEPVAEGAPAPPPPPNASVPPTAR